MKENDLLKELYNPPPHFLFKETLEFGNLSVQSSIFSVADPSLRRGQGVYFIYFQAVVHGMAVLIFVRSHG